MESEVHVLRRPAAGLVTTGLVLVVLAFAAGLLAVHESILVSDALANLLALGAVIVMALGVWSFWVALRTIGARSDRAAGHVPRDVWWSRL
jgi:ABC-type nickel/cobalt efflux system permease component RcnA